MERLIRKITYKDGETVYGMNQPDKPPYIGDKNIYRKLFAYEDTCLSPEDCAEYKKFEDEIIKSGKTFQRIIELIQADKEGDFNDTPITT